VCQAQLAAESVDARRKAVLVVLRLGLVQRTLIHSQPLARVPHVQLLHCALQGTAAGVDGGVDCMHEQHAAGAWWQKQAEYAGALYGYAQCTTRLWQECAPPGMLLPPTCALLEVILI
jgi:hypothetical protein